MIGPLKAFLCLSSSIGHLSIKQSLREGPMVFFEITISKFDSITIFDKLNIKKMVSQKKYIIVLKFESKEETSYYLCRSKNKNYVPKKRNGELMNYSNRYIRDEYNELDIYRIFLQFAKKHGAKNVSCYPLNNPLDIDKKEEYVDFIDKIIKCIEAKCVRCGKSNHTFASCETHKNFPKS